MGQFKQLQTLVTIEGDSSASTEHFIQPISEWLNTLDWAHGIFTLQVVCVTTTSTDTLDLSLRTLSEQNNPALTANGGLATEMWNVAGMTGGQVTKKAIYLDPANTTPMEAWVFYALEVNGTSGPWRVTFKVTATLKEGA